MAIEQNKFSIDQMKTTLKLGGARTNLFSVQITPPAGLTSFGGAEASAAQFLIQASKLPEVQIGTIQVPYMGRKLRLPGDRDFPAWNVNVINDEDFKVRNGMEEWMSKINGITTNTRDAAFTSPAALKSSAVVTQYTKNGLEARSYTFVGLYPSDIAAIELSWGEPDQIQSFGVTFMYDYWTVGTAGVGGAKGVI